MAVGTVFAAQLQLWIAQVVCDRSLWPHPTAIRLAMLIAVHLNRTTFECFPSQRRLAALLGVKEEAVRRAVLVLANANHLTFIPGRGQGIASRYRPTIQPGNPLLLEGGFAETNPLLRPVQNPSSSTSKPLLQKEGGTLEEPKKEEPRASLSMREGFDELRLAYPRPGSKERSWQAYRAAIEGGEVDHDELMAKVHPYSAWARGKIERDRTDQFIPMLATWLKDRTWEDDIPQDGPQTQRDSGSHSMGRIGALYRGGLEAAERRKRERGEA